MPGQSGVPGKIGLPGDPGTDGLPGDPGRTGPPGKQVSIVDILSPFGSRNSTLRLLLLVGTNFGSIGG